MSKKILHGMVFLIAVSLVGQAYAACPPMMSPPDFTIMPDDNTQVLVAYSHHDRMQSLVIAPAFHGTATEFGMVLPLPDRPEITEAKESIFDDLNELTYFRTDIWESSHQAFSEGVTVIDTKDVGDFETTTLTAESSDALISWLDENGYEYTAKDAANFEYYVQKTGYYFVALKVNMGEAALDEHGGIDGRLRPVEFSFTSEAPMLPFRSMASDMEQMSLTLYTVSDYAYYVPGTNVSFAAPIHDSSFAHFVLERYDPAGKWLVRMDMDFDPLTIERNIVLSRADDIRDSVRINDDLLPSDSGVLAGTFPAIDLPPFAESVAPLKQQKSGIPADAIECAEDMQLMLRPNQQGACISADSITPLSEKQWQVSNHYTDELARIS